MTGRSFTPGLLLVPGLLFSAACEGGAEGAGGRWEGSVDTLADGRVVVHNTGAGVWTEGEEWAVTEELRIGSMDGAGPATFGQIRSLEADPGGRIWVVESQARVGRETSGGSEEGGRSMGAPDRKPTESGHALRGYP
ncbi:MAG TPA: hypothetical protein VMM83_04940 [Longimicrobiales bacterium]|nr:hypothetical protein [Longimicrobiales bacterium]